MFPNPIPKYVMDHPTYASWFDGTYKKFTGPELSEWLQISLQSFPSQAFLADTPVLPYPEALDYPLGIVIDKHKGLYLTLYYYRLVNDKFVLSGNIRMKLFVKPPSPGKPRGPARIANVIGPYRGRLHQLRSQSLAKYLNKRSRSAGLPSSSPIRPNESVSSMFQDYAEGADDNGVYSKRIDLMSPRVTRQRLWTGVRTPNFGSLAMKGKLPVNAHSVSMFTETGGEACLHVHKLSKPLYYDFAIFHISKHYALPGAPVHLSGVSNKAFSNLAKKVGTIEANLAQDLFEYKKTVNMIAENARRLTMAYKATRRGNFSEALRILYHTSVPKYSRGAPTSMSKSAAENWLMIQYGWKPLLMDIHEAISLISALNKRGNGPNAVLRVTASSSKKSETSTTFPVSGESYRTAGTRNIRVETTVRYSLEYRQASRLTDFLQQTGFTNPLNLAWEVLPYSFVVDWLLPIGPWLETLSLWQGKEFVSGSKTSFTRGYSCVTLDYEQVPSPEYISVCSGEWTREDVILNREKLTSFPTRELPSFKNPLSVVHALNALALLRVGFSQGSKIRS